MFPLKDANPRHGPAVVMWFIVAINLLVYYHMFYNLPQLQLFAFIQQFGFIPVTFFAEPIREASRLISSMFLHGGFYHIVGNMFFLFVFGDNIEDRMGHLGFTLFYLLGGVTAALMHGLFSATSPVPMVGASGAISAVLGAYFVLFPRQRVLTLILPLFVPWLILRVFARVPRFFLPWLPAWLYIGYWAAVQFLEATGGLLVEGGMMSGVAWWAHVGGFVFGVLTVRLFLKRPHVASY
jgi:membrane associated rhomboid family serine protease